MIFCKLSNYYCVFCFLGGCWLFECLVFFLVVWYFLLFIMVICVLEFIWLSGVIIKLLFVDKLLVIIVWLVFC